MNKSDLITAMAADAGITKAAAKAALESLMENVANTLKHGEKVALVGWGTWSKTRRAARIGRNPQWKKGMPGDGTVNIPAKNVAKFRAGVGLNKALN